MIDVHCDKSPSGRHKFDYKDIGWDGVDRWCVHCTLHDYEILTDDERTRLLNAAMLLSADEANSIAQLIEGWVPDDAPRFREWMERLWEYGGTWRGESDD